MKNARIISFICTALGVIIIFLGVLAGVDYITNSAAESASVQELTSLEYEYTVPTEVLEDDPTLTVGTYLLALGVIEEDESGYITAVNGIPAGDHEYWAIYIDGAYAQTGANEITAEADTIYLLRLENW